MTLPETKATRELRKLKERLGNDPEVKTDEIELLIKVRTFLIQCYIEALYVVSCTQRPKVGTAAICISDLYPGKFLVGRRQGSHGEGTYALPGGHLEAGEAWGESTLRELEEEAGITVDDVKTCSHTSMSIGGQLLKKPMGDTNALYATVTNGWMEAESLHYIDIYMLIHLKDSAKVENREPDKCEGKIPWQICVLHLWN
jgi:8-oxo-dGTP diphosphatase